MPHRERYLRAALLLLGLIAGALLAEGVVWLLSGRLFSMDSVTHRFDPELGWVQQPGVTMRRRNEEGRVVAVEGSRLGIRQPSIAYRADAHTVLVVGDSFTAGTQVAFEETWTWQLQSRLREQDPGAQVVNAGVDGYDLSQSYRLVRRLWGTFHPRHLVLALFVGNDIIDYERQAGARPPWDPDDLLDWVRENSYLYHFLVGTVRRPGRAAAPSAEPLPDVGRSVRGFDELDSLRRRSIQRQFASAELLPVLKGTEEGRRCLRSTERLVRAMRELARQRCAGFTLVLIPTKQQAIPEQRAEWAALHGLTPEQALFPQRELRRWAEQSGMAAVDPVDVMAAVPDPQALYWTANMHMTPEGHDTLAGAIAPTIAGQLRQSRPCGDGR